MKVIGSVVVSLNNGDVVLIMLAKDKASEVKLYHYLSIDAFEFKKDLSENMPEVAYLSAGHRTEEGKLEWNKEYIELPKWYDLN